MLLTFIKDEYFINGNECLILGYSFLKDIHHEIISHLETRHQSSSFERLQEFGRPLNDLLWVMFDQGHAQNEAP